MTTDQTSRLADVPAFEIAGATFRCFAEMAQPGTPYVWRDASARLAVGRRVVLRHVTDADTGELVERAAEECWARIDGRLIGSAYPSLKTAMAAAAMALAAAAATQGGRHAA